MALQHLQLLSIQPPSLLPHHHHHHHHHHHYPFNNKNKTGCSLIRTTTIALHNITLSSSFLPSPLTHLLSPFPSSSSSTHIHKNKNRILIRALLSQSQPEFHIPPNALLQKTDPNWRGGFSLGVDLGLSRTGVALSKGFSIRPLTVLELRGQKLEIRLLDIAEQEEVDEFIIGLPKSADGKETVQSNKVRSVAGRLAVRAAERGWRVYLQDEYGTSMDALDFMIDMGVKKSARKEQTDAYAAMMVLQRYFRTSGEGSELVLPKQLELQEKLKQGPPKDLDFFPEELEG